MKPSDTQRKIKFVWGWGVSCVVVTCASYFYLYIFVLSFVLMGFVSFRVVSMCRICRFGVCKHIVTYKRHIDNNYTNDTNPPNTKKVVLGCWVFHVSMGVCVVMSLVSLR